MFAGRRLLRQISRISATTLKKRFGAAQANHAAILIYEAAGSLEHMPQRGRVGRKSGTREFTVSGLPFIVIYRVGREAVEIARILHGSQQWPQLLWR